MESESSAAIEEDEDDGGACQGDQRKSGEIGDQVEVDAHGWKAFSAYGFQHRLRVIVTKPMASTGPL